MWDWYLGQAGFSEQIQRYGEMFWPQMVSALFWVFLMIWMVFMVAAIVVTLSRQADVNREIASAQGMHTGTVAPGTTSTHRAGAPMRPKAA
jgi:uncharacterized protein (DUF58 family)